MPVFSRQPKPGRRSRWTAAVPLALFLLVAGAVVTPAWGAREDEARIQNREGVRLAQSGDWQGALAALEEACRLNPFDDTALTNLACTHNNIGVFLVKEHRHHEAIRHFRAASAQKPEDIQIRLNLLAALVGVRDLETADREARKLLAIRPADPDLALQVALAMQRIEDDEAALGVLETVLERHPRHAGARLEMARLQYRRGNLSEARFHLDQALDIEPGCREALTFRQTLDREEPLESTFDRDASVHFSLTFQTVFSREWARELLEVFEEAHERGGEFLGVRPAQRVQVIVYAARDLHKAKALPEWAGGVYDGKIRLPVPSLTATPEQLTAAIAHEYCHHLVHVLTHGNCPTWLNEGLAQVMEGADPARARRLLARADGTLRLRPLGELAGSFAHAPSREVAERLYAQSLLAVQTLLTAKGLPAMRDLLAGLGRQCPLEEAAQLAFDDSLASVLADLAESAL
ncbi:MAG: tetratricopeptide repeat protein [Candidatus Riflebacteria bacterium]|nr:tetratricopeptide repeat protein [Candidatus Riflebacteria bacterium]